MNTLKMTVLFWIRKQKLNRHGKAPIYCRITVDGLRIADFSTGVRCSPFEWNLNKHQPKEHVQKSTLQEMERKINHAYFHSVSNNLRLTKGLINRFVFGAMDDKEVKYLDGLLREYLAYKERSCAAGEITTGSLKTYIRRYNNFRNWIDYSGNQGLQIDQFERKHLEQFKEWMQTTELHYGNGSSHNYLQKHIQLIKSAYKYAQTRGYIQLTFMDLIKVRFRKGQIVSLTSTELKIIESSSFLSKRLQQVADLFLVQCTTGLSFSDLMKFNQKMIVNDDDGRLWIEFARKKTGTLSVIPLFPTTKKILNKYS